MLSALTQKLGFVKTESTFVKIAPQFPWTILLRDGVVLQKDGHLQKTYAFRGPDLQAASPEHMNTISFYLNEAIKKLPSGWKIQWEVQRFSTNDYPGADFSNVAAFLVDKEREESFRKFGKHYESAFYLTLMYKPVSAIVEKTKGLFLKKTTQVTENREEQLYKFLNVVKETTNVLRRKMKMEPLTDDETVQYLHIGVSLKRHYLIAPSAGMFLDSVLQDTVVETGTTLKIGDLYAPIININDFPTQTYPAILDDLNKMSCEYRWVTRFICQDKDVSLKQLDELASQYYNQRESWGQVVMSALTQKKSDRVDHGAIALESDVNEAQVEVKQDLVSLGKYTSSIMVWDKNLIKALEIAQDVKAVINSHGFSAIDDQFNQFQSFKGMMPGDAKSNIRQLPITSGNLSHVVPISAIWAGMKCNSFVLSICGTGTPHVVCSTGYGTAYFLNLNVGDSGMTWIAGPIGSGKSTLLKLLAIQFKKYKNSQVVILDVDRSARSITYAAGGQYYEPGAEGTTFQPLADLDTNEDRIWACEFVETLLLVQNVIVTPEMSKIINESINLLVDRHKAKRTITAFCELCVYRDSKTGENTIKNALFQYTLLGKYGVLFDGKETTIGNGSWITIEMRKLMGMGMEAAAPALMYIFRYVEKKFTGKLTLFEIDEIWKFLDLPVFADKLKDWLKTLRKANVFCVFATQELTDAVNSKISSTIISQCFTKIYLADEQALSPTIAECYRTFGLTEAEIGILSNAVMKQDYFYKSPLGTRLFQLDLGTLQLALFDNDHVFLDTIKSDKEAVYKILENKKIDYKQYLEKDEKVK